MLAIPAVRVFVIALALCAAAPLMHASRVRAWSIQADTTGDRERALKGFTDRVKAYADQKKRLQGGLPQAKPGDKAATGKAEQVEDTLAARIKIARRTAKPGEVFADAAPYFKQIIERDAETRGIRDAYAAMQEVPAQSPPAVNAIYPEKAGLATVPPLILVNLPRLPDGLEYRFMGRDLILRDREANIIVDFVPGAVPAIKR